MAKRNTYFEDEKIERKIDLKQFARVLRYILPHKRIFNLTQSIINFISRKTHLERKELTCRTKSRKNNRDVKACDDSDNSFPNQKHDKRKGNRAVRTYIWKIHRKIDARENKIRHIARKSNFCNP